jgi:hypothetical protein
MKKLVIVLIIAVFLAVAALIAFFIFGKKPDFSSYLPLKEPRISKKEHERVLEVEFSGDKGEVIGKAFSVLFKAYYSLKGVPKGGSAMKAPKARFRFPIDLSQSVTERLKAIQGKPWTGSVAIPIPAGTSLPEAAAASGAKLGDWEYGDVAEILHLGSYESEPPTIEKLEAFIRAQGYTVIGDHEEEYLRGGGGPIVKPADYWTIIRYRVKK